MLVSEVMDKRYPLEGTEGTMGVAMTMCDSGGKAGVTANAYAFYRILKERGRHERFLLIKGDPKPNAPRIRISFPDSQRKDRKAKARGEVPVLFLNSNSIKDTLNGMMPITEERVAQDSDDENEMILHTRVHYPDWLDDSFFEELTAETRTAKGWENLLKRRNEAWDLLAYCVALCTHRRMDHIKWDDPPHWAAPWPENSLVEISLQNRPVAQDRSTQYGLAQLGESLG